MGVSKTRIARNLVTFADLQESLHEKDWGVVSNHVPVAFLGVELDGKATGVAGRVTGTLLASDGGEARKDGGLGAGLLQEVGRRQLGQVRGDL